MASNEIAGPDFICIGMQKAGTGWLFDQVQYHPDFWMPPVKELNYLLEEPSRLRNVEQRLKMLRTPNAKNGPRDDRDPQFLEEGRSFRGKARDFGRYASLFRYKERLLSGDITPAYSELDEGVIAGLATALPETKIVLIVRDPVSRACSHISEFHRHEKFDAALLRDPKGLRDYMDASDKISRRSFPTEIVNRWQASPAAAQFRYFFFDEISDEPDKARRDILTFVGADADKKSGDFKAGYNRKANFVKLEFPEEAMAVIVEYFRDELNACATQFGSYAAGWKTKYSV